MAGKREYLEFVLEWLSPLGGITSRPMFGGYSLYLDGLVFALVADNVLYLKVDEVTRPRFDSFGLEAFRPFPGNPGTMSYYPPPAEFFEDPDAMKNWALEAVQVSKRARLKEASKKRMGSSRNG